MLGTSQDYLSSLDDAREVWLHGSQVKDVRTSPFLEGCVRELAALYDLQHDEALVDTLTYEDAGERYPRPFKPAMDVSDLVARGEGFRIYAESSYGLLGRSPDYMNTCLTAFFTNAEWFGEYAGNVRDYYEYVRTRDLFVSHSFTNPQTDRSKSLGELARAGRPIALQSVGSDDAGIRVRGARMMATSAPFANELLVMGAGRPVGEGEEDIALGFAVPVGTPGLRFICRESHSVAASAGERLLAGRFDEMDAVAVFDDVLVPWERVFMYRDPRRSNEYKTACRFFENIGQQVLARQVVKGSLVLSVATAVAQTIGVIGFPQIAEKLGRVANWIDVTRSCLIAATDRPEISETGVASPESRSVHAGLRYFADGYPAAIAALEQIAAGGLILTPVGAQADPSQAADIAHYFQGAGVDGLDRVRLFRLAWELTGSSFGSRHSLFERYFLGEPDRAYAGRFAKQDPKQVRAMADRLLAPGREAS